MQCYEYLATRHYVRRYLGDRARACDELELAEALDERGVSSLREAQRLVTARPGDAISLR